MVVIFKNNLGRRVVVDANEIIEDKLANEDVLAVKYGNKKTYFKVNEDAIDKIFYNILSGNFPLNLLLVAREVKTENIVQNVRVENR